VRGGRLTGTGRRLDRQNGTPPPLASPRRTSSGHSLRAGLATAAAIAGASEPAIMRQTGHRSADMLRRYVRDASLFREMESNASLVFWHRYLRIATPLY
jgi:integrase